MDKIDTKGWDTSKHHFLLGDFVHKGRIVYSKDSNDQIYKSVWREGRMSEYEPIDKSEIQDRAPYILSNMAGRLCYCSA